MWPLHDTSNVNIGIIVRKLSNPGGAERSQFRLAERLGRNHSVDIIGLYGVPGKDQESLRVRESLGRRIPVSINRLYRLADARFRGYRQLVSRDYDLIITQHAGVAIGATLKRRQSVPHIVFVHDYEPLGMDSPPQPNPVAVATTFVGQRLRRIIEHPWYVEADAISAPSEYMARQLREFDLEPLIINALVPAEKFGQTADHVRNEFQGDFRAQTSSDLPTLLHITPTISKGIETTLDVAAMRPNWQIVLVGRFDNDVLAERANNAPNIEPLGHIPDIRDAYRRADVLLIPSKWAEPGATVAIEAGLAGIPPIVSDRGGLPELVANDEQLVRSERPGAYVETAEDIFDSYDEYSQSAEKYARGLRADVQIKRFRTAVQDRCGLSL